MQVECELFPNLQDQKPLLLLRTMSLDDSVLLSYRRKVKAIVTLNSAGPEKYIQVTYSKYADLLNGNADLRVTDFLKEDRTLAEFKKVGVCSIIICIIGMFHY